MSRQQPLVKGLKILFHVMFEENWYYSVEPINTCLGGAEVTRHLLMARGFHKVEKESKTVRGNRKKGTELIIWLEQSWKSHPTSFLVTSQSMESRRKCTKCELGASASQNSMCHTWQRNKMIVLWFIWIDSQPKFTLNRHCLYTNCIIKVGVCASLVYQNYYIIELNELTQKFWKKGPMPPESIPGHGFLEGVTKCERS